jgi:phage/plasmid-like protein (TIGR03299 family)
MSHEILIENGKASMMYFGEVPWHGLGTRLDGPATSAEAITSASLNWKVEKQQLYLKDNSIVKDTFSTTRLDSAGKPVVLGVVGKNYTVLQNSEAFEFFDSIVGEKKAIYHTAGALLNGKVIWILAKLPEQMRVIGNDIVDKYLLLSNSHDASSGVQVKFTPVRVVCNNTLTMALNNGFSYTVWHQKDIKERLKDIPKLLGLIDNKYSEIEKSFQRMTSVELSNKTIDDYLYGVFPDPKNLEDEYALETANKNRDWSKYFFEQGVGNTEKSVAGTLWSAYNGVTEYVDHKVTKQNRDKRLNTIWFGDGYQIKARAYNVALDRMVNWKN